jgi:hypothetical protein
MPPQYFPATTMPRIHEYRERKIKELHSTPPPQGAKKRINLTRNLFGRYQPVWNDVRCTRERKEYKKCKTCPGFSPGSNH